MYNYSGYFIFLFVFIKVIFKKPEQVKSIILIQFSFFCLYCYNFTASRVHQSISVPLLAVNASVCFFISVITL